MEKIPYKKIKIEDSYLVWFEKTNLYFQLKEPAWFVFEKLANGCANDIIANEFSDVYGIDLTESNSFVSEMSLKVEEMNYFDEFDEKQNESVRELTGLKFKPFSVHHYKLGGKIVKFSVETDWLEKYIHPLICHLEVDVKEPASYFYELFTYNDEVIFRFNNEIKGVWFKDESHLVKGMVFLYLINVLHEKSDSDWLMTVHASAITNGNKTILFSAAPGSGKTTMAALLQSRGYHLISDDFVPFDKASYNAYPFPIAMSVKEGAMKLLVELYPELESKPVNYISPEKNVRYLPIENEKMGMIFPATEIVFIKYDNTIDFNIEKLELLPGFTKLLEQIWVPPDASNVELLFERLSTFDFYELTYSDNEQAIGAIRKLFEND